jgi:hypothetical protein
MCQGRRVAEAGVRARAPRLTACVCRAPAVPCGRAQVAGTEMGVTEPEATFSACYGGAFLMWCARACAAARLGPLDGACCRWMFVLPRLLATA